MFCPPVLQFCIKKEEEDRWKRRRKKKEEEEGEEDILGWLRQLYKEFPCDISLFICIITQFASSLLSFFFLP
jgi:hypothetical protein